VLLDKSILIHASPGRVFAWLAPARQPVWDKSLLRSGGRDEAPLHEGARFDRVASALGCRFESAAEAVAVEDGHLFAWRQVQGDYEENEGAFVLEPAPGGTLLHFVADVELPFVLPRIATEAEVRAEVSRSVEAALFNLKEIAEAEDAGKGRGARTGAS
jgi:uncharacterized membrane protein